MGFFTARWSAGSKLSSRACSSLRNE